MKEVKSPKKPLIFYYLIALLIIMLLNSLFFPKVLSGKVEEVSYDKFLTMVDEGKINEVDLQSNQIVFSDKEEKPNYYKTGRLDDPEIVSKLYASGAKFGSDIVEETSPIMSFIFSWVLPIVFLDVYKRQVLEDLKSKITVNLDELPAPENLTEVQYSELVRILFDDKCWLESRQATAYTDSIDYYTMWAHQILSLIHIFSDKIKDHIVKAEIYSDVFGSDHCPVGLEIF